MPAIRYFKQLSGPVLDVTLPPRCWADGSDAAGALGLSDETRAQIARLSMQRYCFHCGLNVGPFEAHDARDPCGRCGEREVGVAHVARVGVFKDPLIALIHRLKFGRSWEIARILAPFLFQSLLRVSEATHTPVEALIPVPLHWSRRMMRGFNQAEELARETAALAGSRQWPVLKALRRKRRTSEQARIESPARRAQNLRGAFTPARANVAGLHVWLIDDVSTTGATIHAAAAALRRRPPTPPPASINAAVLCITDHRTPGATPAQNHPQ
jgi:ComF family protein